jgi:cyclase
LDCDFGVPGGRVVKGIEFKQIRYAGIPWDLAAEYDEQGAGADKVSVNTAALKNSKLVNELARRFGSQACMVAIDAKRRYVRNEDAAREIIETKEGKCWFECSFYGSIWN